MAATRSRILLASSLVLQLAAAAKYEGPFTSFAGNEKCSHSVPPTAAGFGDANVNFGYDPVCDGNQVPSAWQHSSAEADTQYDLAIVGSGIGAAYLVSRLFEEFVLKRGQSMPKVALYERTQVSGGRLLSAFGAGALNEGMTAFDLVDKPQPLQEYGGMRIDPSRYPLSSNYTDY